ncbi:MAG: efflux RND transporter periplasmic adaptor subunit [Deltaproteobacteria bacterium]|nr:efflux RND transporter periplasmic adaptor subunit [Deltaproteobacteria bacterium]
MKWALLAVVAAAIGVSFFVGRDEAPDAASAPKGPRPAAVAVATVGDTRVVERATYPGELDADAADVAALFAGRLDRVHVRIGDLVAEGAPIATVTIVDLAEQRDEATAQIRGADADIARTRAELDAAQRDAARFATLDEAALVATREAEAARARARALAADLQSARARLAEAEARLAQLERRGKESEVSAPFTGRVVDRYADPGGFVATGTRLVRLVESGPLRARFEVPEQDVGRVRPGAAVDIAVPALGPATAPARITGVGGEVLRDRRVVLVEALLDHHPDLWLAGMYASASVVHRMIERGPVVPEGALLSRVGGDGRPVTGVFRRDDAVARWVPVDVLAREGSRVAVAGELTVGAEVLVQGHQDLSDGAAIRVAAPPAPAPGAGL